MNKVIDKLYEELMYTNEANVKLLLEILDMISILKRDIYKQTENLYLVQEADNIYKFITNKM